MLIVGGAEHFNKGALLCGEAKWIVIFCEQLSGIDLKRASYPSHPIGGEARLATLKPADLHF